MRAEHNAGALAVRLLVRSCSLMLAALTALYPRHAVEGPHQGSREDPRGPHHRQHHGRCQGTCVCVQPRVSRRCVLTLACVFSAASPSSTSTRPRTRVSSSPSSSSSRPSSTTLPCVSRTTSAPSTCRRPAAVSRYRTQYLVLSCSLALSRPFLVVSRMSSMLLRTWRSASRSARLLSMPSSTGTFSLSLSLSLSLSPSLPPSLPLVLSLANHERQPNQARPLGQPARVSVPAPPGLDRREGGVPQHQGGHDFGRRCAIPACSPRCLRH